MRLWDVARPSERIAVELDSVRVIALRAQRDAWRRPSQLPSVPSALSALADPLSSVESGSWLWYWLACLSIEADVEVSAARATAARCQSRALRVALAASRNKVARCLGFDDYPALIFASLSLSEDAWLETLDALGAPALPPSPVSLQPRPGELQRLVEFMRTGGFALGTPDVCTVQGNAGARTFVFAPDDVSVMVAPPRSDSSWRAACHELGHAWRAHCLTRLGPTPWPLWEAPTRAAEEGVAEWVADLADGVAVGREVLGLGPDAAQSRSWARQQAAQRRVARTAYLAAAELALYRRPGDLRFESERGSAQQVLDPGAQLVYAAAEAERRAMVRRYGSVTDAGTQLLRRIAWELPAVGGRLEYEASPARV